MCAHLEGESREMAFAQRVHDAERHAADVDRGGVLEGADHEGHQIGGHDHGGGEVDPPLAVRLDRLVEDRAVGVGGEAVIDHQGDLEGCLELRLVEAREGSSRVGGLHLRGGDDPLLTGSVGKGRAVEAVQLVVEDSGECDVQGGRSGGQGPAEREHGALFGGVERDRGGDAVGGSITREQGGRRDLELSSVEHDVRGIALYDQVDRHFAGECGQPQIRSKCEPIVAGQDRGRKPVGGRVVGVA